MNFQKARHYLLEMFIVTVMLIAARCPLHAPPACKAFAQAAQVHGWAWLSNIQSKVLNAEQ